MRFNSHKEALADKLRNTKGITRAWIEAYEASPLRLPRKVNMLELMSDVESIIEAFVQALDLYSSLDQEEALRAGSVYLREVEKEASFVGARLGVAGYGGFDIGALMIAMRDLLVQQAEPALKSEITLYMEWLAILACNSLSDGRLDSEKERWENQLDNGTPLVMLTAELPAVFFVCCPSKRVASRIFSRLLLCIVRVGAKAAIIDVSGMSIGLEGGFREAFESFLSHEKIHSQLHLYLCGVKAKEQFVWRDLALKYGAKCIFENYFDVCVSEAIEVGGWRLLSSI